MRTPNPFALQSLPYIYVIHFLKPKFFEARLDVFVVEVGGADGLELALFEMLGDLGI